MHGLKLLEQIKYAIVAVFALALYIYDQARGCLSSGDSRSRWFGTITQVADQTIGWKENGSGSWLVFLRS